MRILISSNHTYPARIGGVGSQRIYDSLAQGLAELGHDVYYHLNGWSEPLPKGVTASHRLTYDADILHLSHFITESVDTHGRPWVRTYHAPNTGDKVLLSRIGNNFIFVSRSYLQEQKQWLPQDPRRQPRLVEDRRYSLASLGNGSGR